MFKYDHVDVLIVGAGPVGLMTALLLTERGLRACVIDKEHRTNIHSYALALHPSSQELLQSVEALEPLEKHGRRIGKTVFYTGRRREIEVELPARGALVLPQSALEAQLEEQLAEKGVEVLWLHELDYLDDEGGKPGVIAVVNKMQDTPMGYPVIQFRRMVMKTRHIRAGFVVGADGFRSRVRTSAGIPFECTGERHYFSLYEGKLAEELPDETVVVCDREGTSVLWPMAEGRFRWSFEIDDPEKHDPGREAMERLLGERAPWFDLAGVESVDWTAIARFENSLAARMGRGPYWLAGDSAHHAHPIGVHSLNSGLREAHELAWRMFEILKHGAKPGILDEYSEEGRSWWEGLLHPEEHYRADGTACPWVRENLSKLVTSLPLGGRNHGLALERLGVVVR